jgi:hypothetical protein
MIRIKCSSGAIQAVWLISHHTASTVQECRSAGTKIFTELEGTNVNIPSKAPKEKRDGRVVLNKIALVRWPGPRSVWQRLGNHVSPCAWCTAPALHCGLFRAASWRALQPAPRGTPARRLKSGLNFNASIGSARLVHRSCPEPCGCESLKVEAGVNIKILFRSTHFGLKIIPNQPSNWIKLRLIPFFFLLLLPAPKTL